MILETIGWNSELYKQFEEERSKLKKGVDTETGTGKELILIPGRVKKVVKGRYILFTEDGEVEGMITGKLSHRIDYAAKYPTVGDWVVLDRNLLGPCPIRGMLPRRGLFQRQEAGDQMEAQLIAANVDQCFIMQAYGHDVNSARLDRYVNLSWNSGAVPVVVLTKADLAESYEMEKTIRGVKAAFPDIDVISLSALTGEGFDEFEKRLIPGKTHLVLGSSGVGKSTTLNRVLGKEVAKTGEIRESDQRGKHTTTHREAYLLKNGALYIDTPGMRELALFRNENIGETFRDVENYAQQCRFRDCRHQGEPGCAVKDALMEGHLSPERLKSYHKLSAEKKHERVRDRQLQRKLSKSRMKKNKIHYKDYVRNGAE